MVLTARDMARLIELNKKKAEMQFQARITGAKPDGDLAKVAASAVVLAERAKAAKVVLVYPNQESLDNYGRALDEFTPDAIREGLKVRDGKAYQTLKERGMIIKRNYENRFEVAKLLILVSRMGEAEREAALKAVAAGSLSAPLAASTIDDASRGRLARFLCRCGIACAVSGSEIAPPPAESGGVNSAVKEIRIEMQNSMVWVSESSRERLEANIRKMQGLNAQIQLKNAERQIKVFTDAEEGAFAMLQKEYLDLLKEQDEVLKEFNEEEGISANA